MSERVRVPTPAQETTDHPVEPPTERLSRWGIWWWRLTAPIEKRVALPADSGTRRYQKVLVVVVALFGSVMTLVNTFPLFQGGLDAMAWTYLGSSVYILAGALAILVWPRAYVPVAFLLLANVLIFPPIAQVLSGGYGSGMVLMPWTLLAPLGAALALGARAALAHLGLFAATVVVVTLLEPFSQSIAPEIRVEVLQAFNVPSLLSLGVIAVASSLYLIRQVERFRAEADALLINVLPAPIANRLKTGEQPIADRYESVTVLFADIVGFTPVASGADPREVVELLNGIFSEFDELVRRHGVEKIKTIGDAYMAAAGLPEPRHDHIQTMIELALDMLGAVSAHRGLDGEPIRLRIGINTGPAVAGVIGRERFIYDLWGDMVNMASRMESNGLPDVIVVTQAVVDRVGAMYPFEARGPIFIKGKGMTVTYALVPEPSA